MGLTWSHLGSAGFTWSHWELLGLACDPLASLGPSWRHSAPCGPTGLSPPLLPLDALSLGRPRSHRDSLGLTGIHLVSLAPTWSTLAGLGFALHRLGSLGFASARLVALGLAGLHLNSMGSHRHFRGRTRSQQGNGEARRTHARTTQNDTPIIGNGTRPPTSDLHLTPLFSSRPLGQLMWGNQGTNSKTSGVQQAAEFRRPLQQKHRRAT